MGRNQGKPYDLEVFKIIVLERTGELTLGTGFDMIGVMRYARGICGKGDAMR